MKGCGLCRLFLVLVALCVRGVHAQTLTLQGPHAGDFDVSIRTFGVGGQARAGEWVGVLVSLTDHGPNPRSVVVSIPTPDLDGDRAVCYRQIATNPGLPQAVWLYTRLPYSETGRDDFRIELHRAVEGDTLTRGELLLSATGRLPPIQPARLALAGVIGSYDLALSEYARGIHPTQWYDYGAHEALLPVRGITPGTLPDRWHGLAQFDVLVWSQGRPSDLGAEAARALREWVLRGGHLVVVLPPLAQEWLSESAFNPLESILPRVKATRAENVSLEPYRRLLETPRPGDAGRRPLPERTIVHTFEPAPDAAQHDAVPVLTGSDGSCVVIARVVGVGAVTYVGIDLNELRPYALPDASAFWHRVLGRRGRIVSQAARPPDDPAIPFSRSLREYDGMIAGEINQTGRALRGLGLALVTFAAYWALAGPVSFIALRQRGLAHWSWPAFVAVSLVFALLAWGGAAALRPARVTARHCTLMEHVFGQPVQRARTFASVLLPGYGQADVRIGSAEGMTDALTAWDSPGASSLSPVRFPDTREYMLPSADPARASFPTRATVKQIRADWAGPPRPGWGMPLPTNPDGSPGRITLGPPPDYALTGTLVHDLPRPLEDVLIVVVHRQRPLNSGGVAAGEAVSTGRAWRLAGAWEPGQPLDLAVLGAGVRGGDDTSPDTLARFLEASVLGPVPAIGRPPPPPPRFLAEAQFIWNLPLPQPTATGPAPTAAVREALHGWDAARWLTQPCLIIVGHLIDSDGRGCPTPITVNGRPLPTSGRTVIRWIYPLPPLPPSYGPVPDQG